GAPVGLLGIEPHTRRRNRMNGVVTERGAAGFSVAVSQSFGNCPKYIQARRPEFVPGTGAATKVQRSAGLDTAARRLIAQADTFFIATAHPQADAVSPSLGVDVSHRGGKPGFVQVEGDTLTVPDFAGNNFFNTLGNLALNPRCGLLFIDFETGDLLQLAARGAIETDGEALHSFAGAQRLLRLQVLSGLRREAASHLRFGPAELSPHLQATGAWNRVR
ncbi:MAG: flavin-nucleotide-binding protein, partial [Comamonadaceae bacterium]